MYEYEKYVTNKDGLAGMIKKYGVAIIPEVLSEKECKKMEFEMWDYFETISQTWESSINRHDKNSWRGFYELSPLQG
ncbi:hypothetical protein OAG24_01200 [bacterium]|nr:hypothetical protein [bacterium]